MSVAPAEPASPRLISSRSCSILLCLTPLGVWASAGANPGPCPPGAVFPVGCRHEQEKVVTCSLSLLASAAEIE